MFTACVPLILASASPRRREFLHQLGLCFDVVPACIDETPFTGESPERFADRMASGKARNIAATHQDACIIGADTVVALEDTIFGKPANPAEALGILQHLQGRTHRVITGLSLFCQRLGIAENAVTTTLVTFDCFDDAILKGYVDSGDPLDKAGAYGIQGKGTFLVRSINGSYSNVVGLPIHQLVRLLLTHHLIHPV